MPGELAGTEEIEIRTDFGLLDKDQPIVTPTRARDFHGGEGFGGDGLTVAIRDSGIDETHPIWDYYDVDVRKPDIEGLPTDGRDQVGHGTLVASIVLMAAPMIDELVSVPIFGSSGRTSGDRIERSYQWLMDNADQIDFVNDSWGSRRKNRQIDSWHNELEQAGVDSVVAAGNTDETQGSPATAGRAFSVAGVTLDERMARFSSPTDDVSGLAVNVAGAKSKDADMGERVPANEYDTVMQEIGGRWNYAPGTSFAAPRICGYAASYRSRFVNAGIEAAEPDHGSAYELAFIETATDIKGTDEDGRGYLNWERAVAEGTREPPDETEEPDEELSFWQWLIDLIRRLLG